MDRQLSLSRHSFVPPGLEAGPASVDVGALLAFDVLGDLAGTLPHARATRFTLGVYNVWNSNPPSWLHSPGPRWELYSKRMALMARQLLAVKPDIIAFQVRSGRWCCCCYRCCSSLYCCAGAGDVDTRHLRLEQCAHLQEVRGGVRMHTPCPSVHLGVGPSGQVSTWRV